jgi:RNA polymerase sigma factor (sigma-70 family)
MERLDFDDRFDALAAIAYRVAFRMLGDRGDAEEVAQEALARAYARWRSVQGHAEPWVARVASNLAIGRWRKRRPTIPLDASGSGAGVGRRLAAADATTAVVERDELVESLRRLPRRQREVVVLRYLADLPERDVAAALRTSVGTVKSTNHRALARLRSDLAPALTPAEED